jgi:hypothetical protein
MHREPRVCSNPKLEPLSERLKALRILRVLSQSFKGLPHTTRQIRRYRL